MATGFAAVVAAYIIGRKQVELQGFAARSDLFDKRMEVYEGARRWLDAIARYPEVPKDDLMDEFLRASDRSQFLFRPIVRAEMKRWHQAAIKLEYDEKHSDTGEPSPHKAVISEARAKLYELFEPELSLTNQPRRRALLPNLFGGKP